MRRILTIGTRGSTLALYQARLVQSLLKQAYPEMESLLRIVQTVGDRDRSTALSKVSETANVERGIFIKELEESLREETVDIAVHSLKDMPSVLNEGFALPAFLSRAAREDVLVSKHENGLVGLPLGATVATGGVRRQCQLKWIRPDLKIVEMRGNVPTRLRKLSLDANVDATMLAAAGLERLGYPVGEGLSLNEGSQLYLHKLTTDQFLPPGGQGVIAVECLSKNEEIIELMEVLNCSQTQVECHAERAFLHHLAASCDTPVAVMAKMADSGELHMEGRYWKDGEIEPRRAVVEGDDPEVIAEKLVGEIL